MTFPPTFCTNHAASPRNSKEVVHIDSPRLCALRLRVEESMELKEPHK